MAHKMKKMIALVLVLILAFGISPAAGTACTACAADTVRPDEPIRVAEIRLEKNLTTVVSEITYTFDSLFRYTADLTAQPPAGTTVDTGITLTCTPAEAAVVDNEKGTICFAPITDESVTATLTLTANNAAADCEPVSFSVTVCNDIPLQEVAWDYPVGSSGKSLFRYYDETGREILGHYYESTIGGVTQYMFHTKPEDAISACSFRVMSSEPRVLRVDERNKCLIPVGNGETKLTIIAKTPKGVTKSHTIIVRIEESPYNPIGEISIGYEPNTAPNGVSYDGKTNTLSMQYGQSITLVPKLTALLENRNVRLDQEEICFRTPDGRNLTIVETPAYAWSSSDTSVAKIDPKTGKLEIVGTGKAVISLRVEDNGETFMCLLNVRGLSDPNYKPITLFLLILKFIKEVFTFSWRAAKETWKRIIELISVLPKRPL